MALEVIYQVTANPAKTSVFFRVYADGYVAGLRDKFIADATALFYAYIGQAFSGSAYNDRWNVHLIWEESPVAGANSGNLLDSNFGFGYLSVYPRDKVYAQRQAVNAIVGGGAHVEVVLVDDSRYGGSTGAYGSVVPTHSDYLNIAKHELGHNNIGALGDEYQTGYNTFDALYVPNIDVIGNIASPKWQALITSGAVGSPAVGDSGDWIRPQSTCLMRQQSYPACPVCEHAQREQLKSYLGIFEPTVDNISGAVEITFGNPSALRSRQQASGLANATTAVTGDAASRTRLTGAASVSAAFGAGLRFKNLVSGSTSSTFTPGASIRQRAQTSGTTSQAFAVTGGARQRTQAANAFAITAVVTGSALERTRLVGAVGTQVTVTGGVVERTRAAGSSGITASVEGTACSKVRLVGSTNTSVTVGAVARERHRLSGVVQVSFPAVTAVLGIAPTQLVGSTSQTFVVAGSARQRSLVSGSSGIVAEIAGTACSKVRLVGTTSHTVGVSGEVRQRTQAAGSVGAVVNLTGLACSKTRLVGAISMLSTLSARATEHFCICGAVQLSLPATAALGIAPTRLSGSVDVSVLFPLQSGLRQRVRIAGEGVGVVVIAGTACSKVRLVGSVVAGVTPGGDIRTRQRISGTANVNINSVGLGRIRNRIVGVSAVAVSPTGAPSQYTPPPAPAPVDPLLAGEHSSRYAASWMRLLGGITRRLG